MDTCLETSTTESSGPFRRADAVAWGFSPEAIRYRVATGRWVSLRRGVFVKAEHWSNVEAKERHLLRCAAALLVAPTGAVLSHESAVLVQEIEALDLVVPRSPTLTVALPRAQRPPTQPGLLLRKAALPPSHRATVADLAVTSAARTVVDVCRRIPFDAGVVLADSALRLGRCSWDDLKQVYLACQTWPGARAAGRSVFFADPTAESPLESLVRAGLHLSGLPPPQTQVVIQDGRREYRADFLWPEFCTVGEADGMLKYTDPQVLRDEKLREERLGELGFEVVRVTWQQIRQEPHHTAQRFLDAFERGKRRG